MWGYIATLDAASTSITQYAWVDTSLMSLRTLSEAIAETLAKLVVGRVREESVGRVRQGKND